MDEYEIEPMGSQNEPEWESFYETGSTKPPKDYAGVFAAVLAIGILLGGLLGTLRLLNIRPFRPVEETEKQENLLTFLMETPEITPTEAAETDPALPALASAGSSLDLRDSAEAVPNVSQEGGLSYQQIYEKVIPSVVSITCVKETGTGFGTGVIMSQDGYILTNNHVIDGATAIDVLLTDTRTYPATLIGGDEASDLAVLYITADDLIPAEFGDSDKLQVGDAVAAIGDPLGIKLRGTMTNGIVSAINRNITTGGRTMTLIQTNAALNSGNSGGPLVNCYGQVVGINTMKIGDTQAPEGVEGIGFAIPSVTAKEIVDQLMDQGYVTGRPGLGLEGESVPPLYQYYYRFPSGLYINEVLPDSDAYQAGIRPGDILLQLDGIKITSPSDLRSALYAYRVGDEVSVIIYRDGWEYRYLLPVVDAATGMVE